MIDFNFISPRSSVLAYPCGMGEATALEARKHFRKKLLSVMRSTKSQKGCACAELTPNERNVVMDFLMWAATVESLTDPAEAVNSAFTYYNCNTRECVTFIVWCGYGDFGVETRTACDC